MIDHVVIYSNVGEQHKGALKCSFWIVTYKMTSRMSVLLTILFIEIVINCFSGRLDVQPGTKNKPLSTNRPLRDVEG